MKLEKSYRMTLRDILVLRVSDVEDTEMDELKALAGNLSGLCQIPIVVLQEGMGIDTLSEQDMVKAGWVRMDRRKEG